MNNPSENRSYLPQEEDNLDIKKILFQVLSNWYWFALSIFVGLFVAYMVNRYSEPIYSVSSSLIVKDDDNTKGFTGAENLIQGLKLVKNTKSVQNEIGVLRSYSLARYTVEALGDDFSILYVAVGRRGIKEGKLYKNCPFKVNIDTTIGVPYNLPIYITSISQNEFEVEVDGNINIKEKRKFGEWIRLGGIGFQVVLRNDSQNDLYTPSKRFYFVRYSVNQLSNGYKGKVSIDLNDKKGSIITLTSTGFVAEQEADFLNMLMQSYIKLGLYEKNQIAENTVIFINSQLSEMIDSLHRAELRLQNFRSNNRVIDISQEGSIIYEKLRSLEAEKGNAELRGRYYSYLKKYLNEKKELKDIVAPSVMGVENSQLASLLDEIGKAYIERETLLLSASKENPGFNAIDLKLETLRKTLDETVSSLIDVNKVAISETNRRVADLEKEMIKIPVNERLLIGFEREFNVINKMYSYLMEKRAEAAIAKASNIADNRILDYAMAENATIVKPNTRMNYILGFAIGLMIPLAFIAFRIFFNTRITDIKDISRLTSATLIGTIGHNHFETELPVATNPKSTLAESFRGLRTNLEYVIRDSSNRVITVTSTISGEGKTFVASNLSIILSLTGKRVLLVGLDLRKPKLQSIFNIPQDKGLSTYLIGKDEYNSIVHETKYENLYFAPSGPIPPNPAELIATQRMEEFIKKAKEQFDYIILDTPPVAIVTDALIAARFSDTLLFIVRFNYSDKEVLKLVESIKTGNEIKNIAIIVNDLAIKYRYGYAYGYGIRYGSQYTYGYQYGYSDKSGGYYSDDEKPMTFKEKVFRFFT